MSSDGSVTLWIARLKAGDTAAAQPLWDRYFAALVRLARDRLRAAPCRVMDEEDVALTAFDSFFQGVAAGRFQRLHDRDNLWPLLVMITARKVSDARRYDAARRRGGGMAPDEGGIDEVVDDEPTPAFAAEVADEMRRLLDSLGTEELRAVAHWKFEGYTNAEIAQKLGCALRAVERRLAVIRVLIEKERRTGSPIPSESPP